MKLPRDVSARELVKALSAYGYSVTRQKGSHIRVTTQREGEHHVTMIRYGSARCQAWFETSAITVVTPEKNLPRDFSETGDDPFVIAYHVRSERTE